MRRINSNSPAEYVHSSPSGIEAISNNNLYSAPTRSFNTSRSLKAVNDSSTVDFAYMPSITESSASSDMPVPILPDMYTSYDSTQSSGSPMRPQVYTVSGDGVNISASPMSEVVDNDAMEIDPFSLTEAVGKSRYAAEMKRQQSEPGVMKEVWSGFLDDLLGPKQASSRK